MFLNVYIRKSGLHFNYSRSLKIEPKMCDGRRWGKKRERILTCDLKL